MDSQSLSSSETKLEIESRQIIAIDIDYFYCQVELLKRPELKKKPVAVFQQHIVVTSNYVARKHGVGKLISKTRALELCPEIIFICGSDLSPYRSANADVKKAIERWNSQYDVPIEKLGLDEFYLDVTEIVRAEKTDAGHSNFSGNVFPTQGIHNTEEDSYLRIASHLATDLRHKIFESTGLTTSAGISSNKLLAKWAANMNKPDAQTTFLRKAATEYAKNQNIRMVPGIGRKLAMEINTILHDRIETLGDLASVPYIMLQEKFGIKTAEFLKHASRGQDFRPVRRSELPKIVSVEESFRLIESVQKSHEWIETLVMRLCARLRTDCAEHNRMPGRLSLKIREKKQKSYTRFTSFPVEIVEYGSKEHTMLKKLFISMLEKELDTSGKAFALTLLGVGAHNFVAKGIHEGKKKKDLNKEKKISSYFKAVDTKQGSEKLTCSYASSSSICCPICEARFNSSISNDVFNKHVDECLNRDLLRELI